MLLADGLQGFFTQLITVSIQIGSKHLRLHMPFQGSLAASIEVLDRSRICTAIQVLPSLAATAARS